MTLTTSQCATLAKVAHKGQKYGKLDYFEDHVCEVVKELHFPSERVRQIAYLHDVVEDTKFSLSDLAYLGVGPHVVKCVAWLTHDGSQSYADYIADIILWAPYEAALVKMADLRVNLRMSEKTMAENDPSTAAYQRAKARVQKYQLALLAFKMVEKGPSVITDRNNP
jgi:(p)ppGpp synthase/HD superfamily hydrolase